MRTTKRLRIARTWAAAVLGLAVAAMAQVKADTILFATADNGTTNLFGTLDVTTGQFTQISTTTPLIGALTAAPGGTLVAASTDTNLYTFGPTGKLSPFGTVMGPPNGVIPEASGFLGLASMGSAGFFADSVSMTSSTSPVTTTLFHIAADGQSSSVVGVMGTAFGSFNSGNLAFGPDGNLYYNAWDADQVATLYMVNMKTGGATEVGSGMKTFDPLALAAVIDGATAVLYGVDTFIATDPTIYTVDTTTGMATAIGTVSGLPSGYTLDTIAPLGAVAVPEPSSIALFIAGALGAARLARRRRPS